MKVDVFYRTDPERPLNDPLPEKPGIVFRLLTGDVCDPWFDPDGWFGPEKPLGLMRFRSRIPLPFFAWRISPAAIAAASAICAAGGVINGGGTNPPREKG